MTAAIVVALVGIGLIEWGLLKGRETPIGFEVRP